MTSNIQDSRNRTLHLLDITQHETRSLLSRLDPERIVHNDERSWRVRDVVGHLGVWNWEAVRSLRAYSQGGEYTCISSEAKYDEYNGPAADERRTWTMEQVWTEYDAVHAQFRILLQTMPDEEWYGEMVYPWNERGTVEHLIEIMMTHEKRDHCSIIAKAIA